MPLTLTVELKPNSSAVAVSCSLVSSAAAMAAKAELQDWFSAWRNVTLPWTPLHLTWLPRTTV